MKFNPSNGNNNRAVFELIAGLVVGVGLCVLGLVFLPGAWKIIPSRVPRSHSASTAWRRPLKNWKT
jgi:hypothetical protein